MFAFLGFFGWFHLVFMPQFPRDLSMCCRANYLSSKAKIDQKTGNVSFEDADENLDVDTWKHHGGDTTMIRPMAI